MDWSPEQDRALCAVSDWLAAPAGTVPQVFRLFGYAGTGKTTLAKSLAEDVQGPVFFMAYTGKAAHVLHSKGCRGATTIHKAIYVPKNKSKEVLAKMEAELVRLRSEKPDGWERVANRLENQIREERTNMKRPAFSLNPMADVRDAKLIVVDECSMVDEAMGEDLLSFGVKVLVLGDPAQLPPIRGAGFFTSGRPDFMLTEIHRQARENPIIRLSQMVRDGQTLTAGNYGKARVIQRGDKPLPRDLYSEADQILVGRNATRQATNRYMRKMLGRTSPIPQKDDRLVCLRNNHEAGLLNGQIWIAASDAEYTSDDRRVYLDIIGEDDQRIQAEAWGSLFNGEEPEWFERRESNEFNYGYALTVHKAQGSQWDRVLMIAEGFGRPANYREWLYTGITRAAEQLDLVLL